MRISRTLLISSLLAAPIVRCVTPDSTGRQGHGLIGYGINMYDPICCSACKDITPTYLYCDPDQVMDEMGGMSMVVLNSRQMDDDMDMSTSNDTWTTDGKVATDMATSECIATNTPFLQTAAYCMKTHCDTSVTIAEIEQWWWMNIVGTMPDQPDPSMTYQETLSSLSTDPNATLAEDEPLNKVVLVDEDSYIAMSYSLINFQLAETRHAKYSIIILSTCFILPVFLSFLRFIPLPTLLINYVHSQFIHAPLYGGTITLPLFGQLSLPTRGQALFIGWLILINILCCSIGFRSVSPNAWYDTRSLEIATYISNRSGVISFANIPLLILYAGRNNILLFLTNWSYSTFILLHKTVGILATIEACLHSAIYLQIKLAAGLATYHESLQSPYWIIGILATLSMSLLLPLSIRRFRSACYELFVIVHIGLAILTIVGCWYHIIWRFDKQWGYELWMYIAMAVWGFDRFIRLVRMTKSGIKYAKVYKIDEDYLRVDIPNVEGYSGYVFLYFLNVNWKGSHLPRPWESHPFSIAWYDSLSPSATRPISKSSIDSPELENSKISTESEEGQAVLPSLSSSSANNDKPTKQGHSSRPNPKGITIFVRMEKGITQSLSHHSLPLSSTSVPTPIPILIEGSYGSYHGHGNFLNEYLDYSAEYPNILCIAGGVGITAILPKLSTVAQSPWRSTDGSIKLYWSVRTRPLVDAVEDLLPKGGNEDRWGDIQAHIAVGTRLHLEEIVNIELGSAGKGTLVVVSGPRGMADTVRKLVTAKAREGVLVKFVQESFDW
ncbi:hypothetical protein L486_06899 [Kwoniella mangroviensis CBS 10435]|uniref:Ferric oxidoreductase domain-containing protein n=1 Tax=Kwoniella mangroviensis CBS 10435 TaxID=1331196 RepID=A0A1B9IIG4_9TREE|nr:hypothetical protein L486_06899 [Kwoniella mangroviensis CBS 10435]